MFMFFSLQNCYSIVHGCETWQEHSMYSTSNKPTIIQQY